MTRLGIERLEIRFGDREVVHGIALELAAGEILGLVGESGSGKSMTALATLGLVRTMGGAVRGSIKLNGRELVGLPERTLRHVRGKGISMIFQSPSSALNPVFRVGDVFVRALALHGASRKAAREQAAAAMNDVLLSPDLLRRYPHQLSGGQAQRVAIAMAIALESEVLLADEPTSALDVTVQAEILEILRALRVQRGMSILFISHDLAVVAELCDRVAVMHDGRIVESGPTAEVLRAPRETYTRDLIAAVPRIGARAA